MNEVMERAGVATATLYRHFPSKDHLVLAFLEMRDTESFARSCHILMTGSIVSAAEGDVEAARRGKAMARLLIDQHRSRFPAQVE